MNKIQFIIYANDQEKSTGFYQGILNQTTKLNIPGITEFQLSAAMKIGVIPEYSFKKIIQKFVPDSSTRRGIPKCEIFIYVDSPRKYLEVAVSIMATIIDEDKNLDWGDSEAYCAYLYEHILAFA